MTTYAINSRLITENAIEEKGVLTLHLHHLKDKQPTSRYNKLGKEIIYLV